MDTTVVAQHLHFRIIFFRGLAHGLPVPKDDSAAGHVGSLSCRCRAQAGATTPPPPRDREHRAGAQPYQPHGACRLMDAWSCM